MSFSFLNVEKSSNLSILATTGVSPMLEEAGKRFLTDDGDSKFTLSKFFVSESSYDIAV